MKKKLYISLAAGVVLSALGFYFAFRNVPFDALAASMAGINYLWLIPGAAIGLFSFAVRALRWQVILGSTLKLSFFSAFHPLMIAFMINSVLPGRIGELARPAIIKKQDNVPFSLGMTTIAAERILDAITLIVLFAWVLATVHIDPGLQTEFRGYRLNLEKLENIASAMVRVCIAVAAAVIVVSIPAVQRFLKRVIIKAPSLFFSENSPIGAGVLEKCCLPLTRIIDHIAAGLSMVKQPMSLLLCVAYSALIWLLQAAALYVAALGFPSIALDFSEMTAVFIIICFFIMLPSVPGYWGLWEAGAVFGAALFGVSSEAAAGFGLLSHAMMIFPVIGVGVVSAFVTGVSILGISYETRNESLPIDR
ncbi:MAG: flippase-like domain-containing protein [Desulfobacterales bacterium]|nr:flippase-like domain-containing protein [Desulfobacterales bacterium]